MESPFRYPFEYSAEVQSALEFHRPIVALESTIISHGLPYPENIKLARELEEIVRASGAVPATIMLMKGHVHIGVSEEELQILARPESNVQKVSRRDIAHVLATGQTGATTVSATALLAAKVGISIFATGGIGGVHRDGHVTMDVSADLNELGRTPITVVSAGVKSILDIGRTLEYLETQGVTVVAFNTDNFPAFYTADSGHKAPCRLNTVEECARLILFNQVLSLNSGILIANPIPPESEADAKCVDLATQQALAEANEKNITGRDITPYLLKRIAELTKGASLAANLALVKNNARLAAEIAVEMKAIDADGGLQQPEIDARFETNAK